MRKFGKILACFGVGLVFQFIVILFSWAIGVDIISEVLAAKIWTQVFAIGIGLSLLLQIAISFYFYYENYFEATKLPYGLGYIGRIIPILMTLCAAAAVINVVKHSDTHFYWTLGYLCLGVLWDGAEAYLATPVKGRFAKAILFKDRCRQLFCHIDGPTFLVVGIWLAIVILFWEPRQGDQGKFLTVVQVAKIIGEGQQDFLIKLHTFAQPLSEPLLAGVIGFQMVISVVLLLVHLYEWESQRVPSPATEVAEVQKTGRGKK